MSSSILLEGGQDTNSSLELALSDIVLNTLGDFDQSLLNVTVAPDNDATLLYSVQQNQSKFSYLKHLAAQHGEYLLYAKDTLYFGKPDLGETVNLNLGSSLENISLGIKPIPTKFNYTSNDYLNETEVASTTTAATGATGAGYISFANEVNDRLFTTENKIVLPTFEDSTLQQRADTSVELQKKILEQSQVQITGTSYLPSVSLGKLISVNNQDSHYGTFRVIEIKHKCNDSGNYSNSFTAVPTDIDVYPLTNINIFNRAEVQVAKVCLLYTSPSPRDS